LGTGALGFTALTLTGTGASFVFTVELGVATSVGRTAGNTIGAVLVTLVRVRRRVGFFFPTAFTSITELQKIMMITMEIADRTILRMSLTSSD
jgi:hypothetical protein